MNEIQQSVFESMSILAENIVKQSNSTLTIEAKVLEVLDSGVGAYKVEYMGNKFKAYTNNQSVQYMVGDKIYVLVPDGDFTKEKIIIGAVAPTSNIYAATGGTISNYLEKSENLLTEVSDIELCSYRTETDRPIDFSLGNFNMIFSNYLSKYNTFAFSCKVKTNIPTEQRARGNYGLKLRLFFDIKNADGTITILPRDYIIDVNNMIGDPYGFSVWTTQKFYVTIDSKDTYSKNQQPQLFAFVKDFEQSNEDKPYDIFIGGISLRAVDTLSEEDKSGYYLSISAEEGELFLQNQYKESKKLTPILKVNGRDTSIEGCDCYWFSEDVTIDETNEYYSPRGGRGWKCLNERSNITKNENGTTTFQYITNKYNYTVLKNTIHTTLRYKCVIIYKETVISSIIKIENLDSLAELKLLTLTGSNAFVKNVGNVHLICRVFFDGITNSTSPASSILYAWARYNKKGEYLDNNFYELVRCNKQVEIDGKTYYETEIKFPTSLMEDLNTISCTVKTSQNAKETIIGTETIALTTAADFTYLLSVQNGDVLYKYDADGDSPMIANYDGPESSIVKEIKPLSYQMFKKDGTELTDNEYEFCDVKWTISKRSMIKIEKLDNITEDEENYYVTGRGRVEVPYTIIPQYNSSKTNNTVLLEVKFDGSTLKATAALKFLKDGANGTNGTKYTAIINYQGYGYREVDTNGISRKLQLVYVKGSGWKRYDIESKTLVNFDSPTFGVSVYKDGQLIQNFADRLVQWSIFDNRATNACFKFEDGALVATKNWDTSSDVFCNTVQAKISISEGQSVTNADEFIYAYYPIEITYLNSATIANGIVPSLEGGFSSVLYAADGTNPKYDTAFDFYCVNNLDNNKASDLYTYQWDSSDNLSRAEITGGNCKVKPKEKYDNGESKNYVKVSLSLSSDKKTEATNISTEHSNNATMYNDLVNYYTKNYEYLRNFLALFTYNDWLNTFDSIKNLIVERTYAIDSIKNLLKYLEDFYNYCTSHSAQVTGGIDYAGEYRSNKAQINSAHSALYNMTTGNNAGLVSLSSYKIQITDEALLKQNLSSGYTILKCYIDDYNKEIDKYQTHYSAIGAMRSAEVSTFNTLKTALTNFSANTNLTNLASAHDGQPKNGEFTAYQNDLKSITANFSNSTTGYYSYDDLKNKVFIPLKTRIEVYGIVSKNIGEGAVLNKYYDQEYQRLIAENTRLKEEESQMSQHYSNMQTTVDSIIHIRPIVITYNRYEMSSINGWDGNKLYTGSNNEGDYLFAPQVGAGRKEDDNSFTGMIMGLRKRHLESGSKVDVGLFGYKGGLETLFLNAEDGSATFGVAGAGQIIISPGNGTESKATIYGGNYVDGESGLLIDLTTPEIKFGSGNFEVNAEGHLTAKGGGSIGGWIIGDTTLTSEEKSITLDAVNKCFYSDYHKKLESTNEGFYLGPDGMSIGSTIRMLDNEIYIGNMNGRRWIITAKNNQSYIAYNTDAIAQPTRSKEDSVYLGTDGISLGRYFKVDKSGMLQVGHLNGKHWKMYANSGTEDSFIFYGSDSVMPNLNVERDSVYLGTNGISLGYYFQVDAAGTVLAGNVKNTKHWKITANEDEDRAYISFNTDSFNTSKNSVYIGTDGISLGNDNSFWVTADGTLRATLGIIGGWTLSKEYLISILEDSKKGIKIDSRGEIKAGTFTDENTLNMNEDYWIIDNNGKAVFQNIYANKSGQIGGWSINNGYLKGGQLQLKSDGSIIGPKWSISANGYAEFDDIHITGGTIDWSSKSQEVTESGQTVKKGGFQVSSIGEINAPTGYIGPWTISHMGIFDKEKEVFLRGDGYFSFWNKDSDTVVMSNADGCTIAGAGVYIGRTRKSPSSGLIKIDAESGAIELKSGLNISIAAGSGYDINLNGSKIKINGELDLGNQTLSVNSLKSTGSLSCSSLKIGNVYLYENQLNLLLGLLS